MAHTDPPDGFMGVITDRVWPPPVDHGRTETVKWLESLGFQMCGGDSLRIFMMVQPDNMLAEAHRLKRALFQRAVALGTVGSGATWIRATYDPADVQALLEVGNLSDGSFK